LFLEHVELPHVPHDGEAVEIGEENLERVQCMGFLEYAKEEAV
jgi:hypothetical protein